MLGGRGSRLRTGANTFQRIISSNSYAHDEQGLSGELIPGRLRGFDGVLYKL